MKEQETRLETQFEKLKEREHDLVCQLADTKRDVRTVLSKFIELTYGIKLGKTLVKTDKASYLVTNFFNRNLDGVKTNLTIEGRKLRKDGKPSKIGNSYIGNKFEVVGELE